MCVCVKGRVEGMGVADRRCWGRHFQESPLGSLSSRLTLREKECGDDNGEVSRMHLVCECGGRQGRGCGFVKSHVCESMCVCVCVYSRDCKLLSRPRDLRVP